jgi:hypothetical protein
MKKKPKLPKPRGVWQINPKTRVKPSAKIYRRAKQKKKTQSWTDDVSWFGESKS